MLIFTINYELISKIRLQLISKVYDIYNKLIKQIYIINSSNSFIKFN